MLRVYFTLFNLQGARRCYSGFSLYHIQFALSRTFFLSFSADSLSYCVALASDFIRISHSELFVKNFFQIFFEVLSVFSPPPSQATQLGYHTQNSLSRTFFDLPVISFSTLSEFLVRFPLLAQGFDPSLKRLLILAEPPPIVNCFFRVFHSFFTFLRQPYIFGYFACSNHKMCGLFSCGFISCQKLPPG